MVNPKLPAFFYGGDYNPEQWPESVWAEDMRLMKRASVNVATVGVFSWAALQPEEDVFTFDWLDRVMDLLRENGIYACLATATAAQPAWLSRKYPEVLPVDAQGRQRKHGNRQNFCPNSAVFRRLSAALARRLAERYRDHPALLLWHISNEYGNHCYCDACAAAFRDWLRERYGTLDAVNAAWWSRFWSHTFTEWEQIETPTANGDRTMQGYLIDYDRFQNDAILACCLAEKDALRAVTPDVPITTNMMGTFKPLDYHAWASHLDVISWDAYPGKHASPASSALGHTVMRGLKQGQPFLLLEQTPSQVNWQPYNSLKRPGVLRLLSYQAVAHGSDAVMYFQWRRSRGAFEKFHGAVVEHAGHENTRVFREVAELGRELKALGDQILAARVPARAAILFDWNNWWAVEYSQGPTVALKYREQIERWFTALHDLHIAVDIVSPFADLTPYGVVIAPVLYMIRPGVAERLERFVAAGGDLVATFFSGIVDENDLVTTGGYPGPLRKLLGIWVEEIDPLYPDEKNTVVFETPWGEMSGAYPCGLLCERVHREGAQALATFGQDFYAGEPAITEHAFGAGHAYYVATDPDQAVLRGLLAALCARRGITAPLASVPEGVEVVERVKDEARFLFVLNHRPETVTVPLPRAYTDLLTETRVAGEASLPGRGVWILRADA